MRTGGARSHSVLVVDDEETVRDLTRRALEERGFRCDVASDGVEAENLMRRKPFDAIVLDLRMPRKHGHQLVVQLLQERSHPVVIILTGVCEPKIVRDLLRRGVSDVMLKPCNYDLLTSKLNAYLDRAASAKRPAGAGESMPVSAQIDLTTQSLRQHLAEVTSSFESTIKQLTRQKESLEEDLVRSVGVLESLMSFGEEHGDSHASRVERYARAIGEAAGLTRFELQQVRVAALLHEIGQFGMPDDIRKSAPEELAAAKQVVFQRYPEIGAALISEIPGLQAVVALIESHAENFDGTGFPKRKSASDIPIGARVLRIADGIDLLMQTAAAASDYDAVRAHLREQRGRAYDPDLIPYALDFLAELDRIADDEVQLIDVGALSPGMSLAEGLYDERGQFLARNGATITPAMVELLKRLVPGRKIRVQPPTREPVQS